jgi:uncharacterized membrane protein
VTDNGDLPAGHEPSGQHQDEPAPEQPDALAAGRPGESAARQAEGRLAERHLPIAAEEPGNRAQSASHRNAILYPLARSGYMEYDRVLFFSDAVFAIAITLLAITLRVPEALGHGLPTGKALHDAAPSILGFWISFAVIALFWIGHHGIFRYITALDRPLIALNLLFLGVIAFLPYPTEVLSKSDDAAAIVFYALCASAAGIAEEAIWLYATLRPIGLTVPEVGRVRLLYALRIARVPAVFLLSIPFALIWQGKAQYIWILIWVFGVAINRFAPLRRTSPQRGLSKP